MTIANAARSDASFFGSEPRIDAGSSGLGRAWFEYRAYRQTLGALRDLTNKQLGDIGMTRDALKTAARAAVYGN